MFTFHDLDPGEHIYRVAAEVLEVRRETAPVDAGGVTTLHYTGRVFLRTRFLGIESEEWVNGSDRVHTVEGCS